MSHTKLLRELLHDLNNIMVGVQGSLENVELSDVKPGPTQDSIKEALECSRKLCDRLVTAQQELYASYRHHYSTYKGEPMLKDKNSVEIHLKDPVEVPDAEPNDLWEHSFVGIVISTTRGDGIITVRDTADDCWDVEANRIELIK